MPRKQREICVNAQPQEPIELEVYGIPGPQGSKRHVGKGIMIESSDKVKPWREAIKWAYLARFATWTNRPKITGPVILEVTFCFIKPRTVKTRYPQAKPDLSKLVRSTEDALTDIGAWEDDARVVATMSRKLWAGTPGALMGPGAHIRIREAA